MIYLQVWHASSPDCIHCQVGASKAHEMRLLWEEAVSVQPPERERTQGSLHVMVHYTQLKRLHLLSMIFIGLCCVFTMLNPFSVIRSSLTRELGRSSSWPSPPTDANKM